MKMNVKFKSILYYFYSKKTLPLISLLFITAIVAFPFIPNANGLWFTIHTTAVNEVELRNAINTAPDNEAYTINIGNITLEKPLEIPAGKVIGLVSGGAYLIGGDGVDTIVVKSGGELSLWGGIVVSHSEGDNGRGVYVERGGAFTLWDGVISGNTATKGGGVYNEGVFTMAGGEMNGRYAIISGNTATKGGGVYNAGEFTIMGGDIRENNCTNSVLVVGVGGGVYNEGTFTMTVGDIFDNTATKGGGVYNVGTFNKADEARIFSNTATNGVGDDVFVEETMSGQYYLLAIGVAAVVGVVAVLLFYRSKKNKNNKERD